MGAGRGVQQMNVLEMQIMFNEVIKRKVTVKDFEQWVYATPEIEDHFGYAFYLDLISLDFRDKYIYLDLERMLTPVIPFGELEYRRIKERLEKVASDTHEIDEVLASIYEDYCDGYGFLRFLGLAFALLSGTDGELHINQAVRELLREEARRIMSFIDSGKIKVSGKFEYDDFRDGKDRIELTNVELMLRKLGDRISGSGH